MRLLALLLPALAWSQITKPPEFDEPGAFRKSQTPQGLDGTSHVSARERRLSTTLAAHLKSLPLDNLSPADRARLENGRKLIDQGLGAAALEQFTGDALALRAAHAATLAMLARHQEAAAELLAIHEPAEFLAPFLGELSILVQRPEFAARLRAIAAKHPRNAAARYYLAGLVKPPESETLYREAAALDKTDPRPLLELARLEPDTAKAIAHLLEAVRRDPNQSQAHYRLSQLHARAGNQLESEKHLRLFQALRK